MLARALTATISARLVLASADASADPGLVEQMRSLSPCLIVTETDAEQLHAALHPAPAVVALRVTSSDELPAVPRLMKQMASSPLLLIVEHNLVHLAGTFAAWDDLILSPVNNAELRIRIDRLLNVSPASGNRIVRGDLTIDIDSCEVSLGGRLIELTFKEYELLKFLANPGRVYSRETLLNRIWGYEYYGGDRTVDVHIRRLRSKTEDASHTFIDTVRNVGYRFRKNG